MAQAAGIAAIWREMIGSGQYLSIDISQAAHGINPDSTFHPTINVHPYPNWVGNVHPFGAIPFETKDCRWVYPSGVYPHQHFKYGNFFNCGVSHANIGAAIAKWNASELEEAAAEKGLLLSMGQSHAKLCSVSNLIALLPPYTNNFDANLLRKQDDSPAICSDAHACLRIVMSSTVARRYTSGYRCAKRRKSLRVIKAILDG